MGISNPVYNISTKVVDEKGFCTPEFGSFLSSLQQIVNDYFSANGAKIPQVSPQQTTNIENISSKIGPRINYNTQTFKYQGLINVGGTLVFKNFMMEP